MSDVTYSINANVQKDFFNQQFVVGGLTAAMSETGMLAVTLEPGTSTVRLKPGDAAWLRLAPGDYGARAAADSIPLLIQILED
jgi:hypothetical protein